MHRPLIFIHTDQTTDSNGKSYNDIATELSKPDCREIINSEIVDDSVLFAYNVDTVL